MLTSIGKRYVKHLLAPFHGRTSRPRGPALAFKDHGETRALTYWQRARAGDLTICTTRACYLTPGHLLGHCWVSETPPVPTLRRGFWSMRRLPWQYSGSTLNHWTLIPSLFPSAGGPSEASPDDPSRPRSQASISLSATGYIPVIMGDPSALSDAHPPYGARRRHGCIQRFANLAHATNSTFHHFRISCLSLAPLSSRCWLSFPLLFSAGTWRTR